MPCEARGVALATSAEIDAALLTRVLRDESNARQELWDILSVRVERIATEFLRKKGGRPKDYQETPDIADLVYIQLIDNDCAVLRQIREANKTDAFVNTVVRNTVANYFEHRWKREKETEIELQDTSPTPGHVVDQELVHQIVAKFMENLPSRERLILRLYAWEDLPYAAIGEVLGMTTDHVGVTISRIKGRLKTYFLQRGIDESFFE